MWSKHASLIGNDTFANVFERQKRKLLAFEASLVEEKGRRAHAENENARLEREKTQLIAEIQSLHNAINERTMYIKDLEGAIQVLRGEAELATSESERLLKSIGVSEASRVEVEAHVRAAYAEIERLQGLLNMIYRSRTWKLHAMMERMRGRG